MEAAAEVIALAIIAVFCVLAFTPVGEAVADRIRGRRKDGQEKQ